MKERAREKESTHEREGEERDRHSFRHTQAGRVTKSWIELKDKRNKPKGSDVWAVVERDGRRRGKELERTKNAKQTSVCRLFGIVSATNETKR